MHRESTSADGDRPIDRRRLVRSAGALLLAASLAGCYHDGDGGGDGDDDGGAYSMHERPPAPE